MSLRLTLLTTLLLLSPWARASHNPGRYVYIAFDPYTSAVGVGYGFSAREAFDAATRNIPSDYWVGPWGGSECVAVAATQRIGGQPYSGYGYAFGPTGRQAMRDAMEQCLGYSHGQACYPIRSACARD